MRWQFRGIERYPTYNLLLLKNWKIARSTFVSIQLVKHPKVSIVINQRTNKARIRTAIEPRTSKSHPFVKYHLCLKKSLSRTSCTNNIRTFGCNLSCRRVNRSETRETRIFGCPSMVVANQRVHACATSLVRACVCVCVCARARYSSIYRVRKGGLAWLPKHWSQCHPMSNP